MGQPGMYTRYITLLGELSSAARWQNTMACARACVPAAGDEHLALLAASLHYVAFRRRLRRRDNRRDRPNIEVLSYSQEANNTSA